MDTLKGLALIASRARVCTMKLPLIILVVPLIVCCPDNASAQNIQTRDLMAHCTLSTGADDYCRGFLNGYSDAALLYQLSETIQGASGVKISPPGDNAPLCLTNSVTDDALAQTFVECIRTHPAKANDFAGTSVLEALASRYHCN